MARNYYATDWVDVGWYGSIYHGVHIFATRAGRDGWVRDDPYGIREDVEARDARRSAEHEGVCYLHDGARVPKSWSTDRCWWWEGHHRVPGEGQVTATLQDFRR